jgi:hypothetical protein
MADDREYPDSAALSAEEEEHDSRIAAKMHLFLSRMVQAAIEEEQIDEERATDLMLCSAVQFYVERFETTPRDVGVFCQAIAEEALKGAGDAETIH